MLDLGIPLLDDDCDGLREPDFVGEQEWPWGSGGYQRSQRQPRAWGWYLLLVAAHPVITTVPGQKRLAAEGSAVRLVDVEA